MRSQEGRDRKSSTIDSRGFVVFIPMRLILYKLVDESFGFECLDDY